MAYIDIINIIRDEPDKCLIFERFIKDNVAYVQSLSDGEKLKIVIALELNEQASYLYSQIRDVSAGDRKLQIPLLQNYLESLDIDSPKANLSERAKERFGAKTDIIITAEDSFDHVRTTGGFSIKSHIGSSPTLFNSSQTSGFTYRIVGCDTKGMHELNRLDSFIQIMASIRERYSLEYIGCKNKIFEDNISIVDSRMGEIMSQAMLLLSGYIDGMISGSVSDVCDSLSQTNPIGVNNPHVFYPAKLKAFLFASFAGMTATTPWNGRKKLTGGYIDVDREGGLLYYRAISDDIFENYLFRHTYFDRPDRGVYKTLAVAQANAFVEEGRSLDIDEINRVLYKDGKGGMKNSKKGDFGYVYQREDEFYIDINFQIRFR